MPSETQTLHCSRCRDRADGSAQPAALPLLVVTRRRLAGSGYAVEISERGLRPWLRIDTPRTVIFDGPEPGQRWTERAAILAVAGPPVLVALAVAVVLNELDLPPLLPVSGILALAGLLWLAVKLYWRFRGYVLDRVIDAAWLLLAPRLHEPAYLPADAGFLAALAKLSHGRGQAEARGPALQRALLLAEQAGEVSTKQLAALSQLAIEDAVQAGGDSARHISRTLERVVQGALPLPFAQDLLERWRTLSWTTADRTRLRVLLAASAFEAGLNADDLAEIGILAPALGDLLQTGNIDGLAQLQLLWTLRASRPWQRCGDAFTVFELAGHAKLIGRPLETLPDLLLWQTRPETGVAEPPTTFGLCGRGVVFGSEVLTQPPDITVHVRKRWWSVDYELTGGPVRFRYTEDPTNIARRLEEWCRYCFQEFLPQTRALRTSAGHTLPVCASCQRLLLQEREP